MMLLTHPNTLSEQQCRELEELKTTTKEVKLYRRAKVILYRNGGYTPDEIEEHTDYSEREQRYLVRRYREEGVAGLADRPRSGRPKGSGSRPGAPSPRVMDPPQEMTSDSRQVALTKEAIAPDPTPTQETLKQEDAEKKKKTTLSVWARLTLESMHAYHPKRYLRQRAHIVLLREKGYAREEIAEILGVTAKTVGQIWARYDRHQLAGLYRQPGSGGHHDYGANNGSSLPHG